MTQIPRESMVNLEAAENPLTATKPIRFSGGVKSISDDDLCAQCHDCAYRPGEMSSCSENWPGLGDGDGYVQTCEKFRFLDPTNRRPHYFASFIEDQNGRG